MKKIKKILAFVLSTSMLLGGMNIQAFAGEQKVTFGRSFLQAFSNLPM